MKDYSFSGISTNNGSSENKTIIEVYFAETKEIIAESEKLMNYANDKDKSASIRLRDEQDRNTYLICHTLLRLIISKKLNAHPSEIQLINDGKIKPHIDGLPLFFNISHTRNAFILAVCDTSEVGVDLEEVNRELDFKSIIRRFFSASESTFILESPEDAINRFFLIWTRKEAILKARGTGIISDLSQIEVLGNGERTIWKSNTKIDNGIMSLNHYLYSQKILNFFFCVAAPVEFELIVTVLNAEKVGSYYLGL
jgi:4'-phosphopantetheinyl transferase